MQQLKLPADREKSPQRLQFSRCGDFSLLYANLQENRRSRRAIFQEGVTGGFVYRAVSDPFLEDRKRRFST